MANVDLMNIILTNIQLATKSPDVANNASNIPATNHVRDTSIGYESNFSANTVKNLYMNSAQTEVGEFYFVFDSTERVPAHKYLLCAGSEVFRTQLQSLSVEGKRDETFFVSGVSADAFEEFLQFFYKDDVKLTMENVPEVLRLIKQYKIDECMVTVGKFLRTQLNESNIFEIYDLAIECSDAQLMHFCQKIIGFNGKEYFASDGFKKCSRNVLSHILDMEGTMRFSEAELFEACMAWVKAATKKDELTKEGVKDELGDLFYKIRFGSMTVKDIGQLLFAYGKLFEADEFKNILQKIMPGDLYSEDFCMQRQPTLEDSMWANESKIISNRDIGGMIRIHEKKHFMKNIEMTVFTVDGPLVLGGIELARPMLGRYKSIREDIPTKITITELNLVDLSEKILIKEQEAVIRSTKCDEISRPIPNIVPLSKLILLNPDRKYTYAIQLEQSPPKDCAYYRRLRLDLKVTPNINVKFYKSNNQGENTKYTTGAVRALHFLKPDDDQISRHHLKEANGGGKDVVKEPVNIAVESNPANSDEDSISDDIDFLDDLNHKDEKIQ